MAFNALAFITGFDGQLTRLGRVENVTKVMLQSMSRDLLSLLHGDEEKQKAGDIGFINRTLKVLSPANRRIAVLFFKEHTGFIYNDDLHSFQKKSKKHYDEVKIKTLDKIKTDPLFNIWTWQEIRVKMEVEPTPYTLDKVQEALTTMLKKATKVNITKKDILGVMLNTGFTLQDIIDCLDATNHLDDAMNMVAQQYVQVEA